MAVRLKKLMRRPWFGKLLWKYEQHLVEKGRLRSTLGPVPQGAFVGLENERLVVYAATSSGEVVSIDISRNVSQGDNCGGGQPSFFWSDLLVSLMAEACPEMLGVPDLQDGVKLIRAVKCPKEHYYFCLAQHASRLEEYVAAEWEKYWQEVTAKEARDAQIKENAIAWAQVRDRVTLAEEAAKGATKNSPQARELKAARQQRNRLLRIFEKNPEMCPHADGELVNGFTNDPYWRCNICGK